MQADWEFEVGGDAPVIDAHWDGFFDLRATPERVCDLPETAKLPGLAAALLKLNSRSSKVWTSKCDFWANLEPEEFDADELDAPGGEAAHAAACYVDLLPEDNVAWSVPHLAEAACKQVCGLLGSVPLRCCRADLIVRRAAIAPGRLGLGVTAYLTACGVTPAEAARTLEKALDAFADALCLNSTLQ
jgi:hypothetical protein